MILNNEVTKKGTVLTQMSKFWFDLTEDILPNHMLSVDVKDMPEFFQQEKYDGKFPIWVIIEFFSMGMLSYFYADLQSGDQKYIAKEIYDTSVACLKSWLRCITDLRNRCAHYSRLYYWSFTALPKMPKESVAPQNRKLFSQILVLKRLYPDKKEWNSKVMTELRAVIEEYEDDISLKHIGFPQDWYEQLER